MNILRNFCHKHRVKIKNSKVLSLLYLTCMAWVPVVISVLLSYIIILIRIDLAANTGALMICGALIGEVLYFGLSPNWKAKVQHLGSDIASTSYSKDKSAIFYDSPKIPSRYYFDDLTKDIRVRSSSHQRVIYDLNYQIDELSLLKWFDPYSQLDSKNSNKVRLEDPSRTLDLTAAAVISATLFFGTVLWGFGELVV